MTTKYLIPLTLAVSLGGCVLYTPPDCVPKSKDPKEASYECLPGFFNSFGSGGTKGIYGGYSGGYYGGGYSGSNPVMVIKPEPGTRVMTYGPDMWSSTSRNGTSCYGAYGSVSCY